MRIVSECDCRAQATFNGLMDGWFDGRIAGRLSGPSSHRVAKEHVFNAHAIQSSNFACKQKPFVQFKRRGGAFYKIDFKLVKKGCTVNTENGRRAHNCSKKKKEN